MLAFIKIIRVSLFPILVDSSTNKHILELFRINVLTEAYLHSGKCGIFQGRHPQRGGKFENELQLVIIRFETSNL